MITSDRVKSKFMCEFVDEHGECNRPAVCEYRIRDEEEEVIYATYRCEQHPDDDVNCEVEELEAV